MKEIIEKLKKQVKNMKCSCPVNTDVPCFLTINEAEKILQALEEEPFLGCDTCESTQKPSEKNCFICENPSSWLEGSILNKTTSCIHHSGRKEPTELEKLFSQITEKDIEEFIEYIKKRKDNANKL